MKKLLLILTLFIITFFAFVFFKSSQLTKFSFDEGGFTLACPKSYTIEKKTPVEDFNIYTFKVKNEVRMILYEGNAPRIGIKKESGVIVSRKVVNSLVFEEYFLKTEGNVVKKEVLVRFANTNWPQFLHFAYCSNRPDIQKTNDGIIESIRKK